jgi:hypothetical protein
MAIGRPPSTTRPSGGAADSITHTFRAFQTSFEALNFVELVSVACKRRLSTVSE